jgi:hypothetical protein
MREIFPIGLAFHSADCEALFKVLLHKGIGDEHGDGAHHNGGELDQLGDLVGLGCEETTYLRKTG